MVCRFTSLPTDGKGRTHHDRPEHRREVVDLDPAPAEHTPHRSRVHVYAGRYDETLRIPCGDPAKLGGTVPTRARWYPRNVLWWVASRWTLHSPRRVLPVR